MNKLLPFLTFSILLLIPVGSQTAYAGFSCQIDPDEVTLTLEKGEPSDFIPKMIDCNNSNNPISSVGINSSDCDNKGIIFDFVNPILTFSSWQIDELFLNSAGAPGQTHCQMTFTVFIPNEPNDILVQDIWVTTPEIIVNGVGGESLPIDSTALLLAGLQSSAIWMLPVLAGAAGAGFAAFKIRKRI